MGKFLKIFSLKQWRMVWRKWKGIRRLKREKIKRGNEIIIINPDGTRKNVFHIEGLSVKFSGKNSKIEIYAPYRINRSKVEMRSDSVMRIGARSIIGNMEVLPMNSAKLTIGEDFSCVGCQIKLQDEARNHVIIGDDCMFSYDIVIWPSDGHALYDTKSRKVINKPQKGVKIGNHVWVGRGVSILKDVEIADNVTIGACAIVNKDILESEVVAAGVPAKIVKRNVNWKRENTDHFEDGVVRE